MSARLAGTRSELVWQEGRHEREKRLELTALFKTGFEGRVNMGIIKNKNFLVGVNRNRDVQMGWLSSVRP